MRLLRVIVRYDGLSVDYTLTFMWNKIFIKLLILFLMGFNFQLFAQEKPSANMGDSPYMNAYIVLADTSDNFYHLADKMQKLKKALHQKIDMFGREYNKEKQAICWPESTDKYDVSTGEYLPRRFFDKTLSIEYLWAYTRSKSNTMVIVTYITEDKKKAEKHLEKLKKHSPQAFIINTMLYMGCYH